MDLISCVLYNTHNHTFGCSLSLDKSKFNIYQSNQRTRIVHKEHTRVNQMYTDRRRPFIGTLIEAQTLILLMYGFHMVKKFLPFPILKLRSHWHHVLDVCRKSNFVFPPT